MVLPASGKTLEQFHTDDLTCQQLAAHEIAGSSSREITRQRRFDIAYMQCMYANGRQIPIPGGQPSYTSAPGAGKPTTAPVVPSVGVPTATDHALTRVKSFRSSRQVRRVVWLGPAAPGSKVSLHRERGVSEEKAEWRRQGLHFRDRSNVMHRNSASSDAPPIRYEACRRPESNDAGSPRTEIRYRPHPVVPGGIRCPLTHDWHCQCAGARG